jgi:hypothetical protein
MCASTLTIVLAGFMAAAGLESPSWQSDYRSAQRLGREGCKPLAVFIGSGKAGWNQMTRDRQLGAEVKELLTKTYICVYIDTAVATGKQLASEFEIPKGPGIIISDQTGKYQAFRHQGDLSSDQLVHYLRRYADPKRVVRTTETNPTERASYSAAVEPSYQPIRYAPVYSTRMSGSC